MIYKVERMATSKKYASEDASFWMESGDVIVAGVFDGCGGAQESHFASNLFMRILRNIMSYEIKNAAEFRASSFPEYQFRATIKHMCSTVAHIAGEIGLTFYQLQSTVVLAFYNKKHKTLFCSILGDGFIHYKDEQGWNHIDLHLPGNAPDYLGYYILEDEIDLVENIAKRPFYVLEGVEEWSIGSDGIDSIKENKSRNDIVPLKKPLIYLLEDFWLKSSEAMLERKVNIILHQGSELGDDLTIIRYIPDENKSTEQSTSDIDGNPKEGV